VRGGPDLGQPCLRHDVPEPGDGLEQVLLAPPWHGPGRDPLVQAADRGIEDGEPVQVQAAQHRVMLGEPACQRHRQVSQTEPSLMPADSSALPSRWISEVRAWTVLTRYLVRSRSSFSPAAGI
jgi:hypothetical protein